MTFYVGQKVVCVDASSWHPDFSGKSRLVKGRIYTVAAYSGSLFLAMPSVRIEELHPEQWMNASRFRPVVTKSTETGMAILRELLNTSPVSADHVGV